MASDPVALDQPALNQPALDLVRDAEHANPGELAYPGLDVTVQNDHAEKNGLGIRHYELAEVS